MKKQKSQKSQIFFKYCIICEERFKPTGKATKICEKCKKIKRKETTLRLRKINKNKNNINTKIQTIIECPNCKTKMDISEIKEAIKNRIDIGLNFLLSKI